MLSFHGEGKFVTLLDPKCNRVNALGLEIVPAPVLPTVPMELALPPSSQV